MLNSAVRHVDLFQQHNLLVLFVGYFLCFYEF